MLHSEPMFEKFALFGECLELCLLVTQHLHHSVEYSMPILTFRGNSWQSFRAHCETVKKIKNKRQNKNENEKEEEEED